MNNLGTVLAMMNEIKEDSIKVIKENHGKYVAIVEKLASSAEQACAIKDAKIKELKEEIATLKADAQAKREVIEDVKASSKAPEAPVSAPAPQPKVKFKLKVQVPTEQREASEVQEKATDIVHDTADFLGAVDKEFVAQSAMKRFADVEAKIAAEKEQEEEVQDVVTQSVTEALAVIAANEERNKAIEEEMAKKEYEEVFPEDKEEEVLVAPAQEDEIIPSDEEEEEDNPFANLSYEEDVIDDGGFVMPSDLDAPPAEEEEEEVPMEIIKTESLEVTEPEVPAMPDFTPDAPMAKQETLKKGEVKVSTYDVLGKEVSWVHHPARINSHKEHLVRKFAMGLNNIMKEGNARNKARNAKEAEVMSLGKFYSQMVREWGMEIAAANNIQTIVGDAGAAMLIGEVFHGFLKAPKLQPRNEQERKALAKVMENPSQIEGFIPMVKNHATSLALNPETFAGTEDMTNEDCKLHGTALLYIRMQSTWANAVGENTVCVFNEVKKENVMKKQIKSTQVLY